MALCTLANLKTRMGISGSGDDTLLGGIITGVSARMARACGRVSQENVPCLEKVSVTDVLTVLDSQTETIWVSAWPIVSITTVKEGYYGDFDDSDALTDKEDYFADLGAGALHRVGGAWLKGKRTVEVAYVGGYTAAGDEVGEGETALPGDIVDAAYQQCQYLYQRRAELGAQGVSVAGGSISWAAAYGLLPDVEEVCKGFRRIR